MHAVAGVDDGDLQDAGQKVRRSGGRMTGDDTVRAQRRSVLPVSTSDSPFSMLDAVALITEVACPAI